MIGTIYPPTNLPFSPYNLLTWLQNMFYLGMGEELVISPLQHGWNRVVLFFPSTSFSLGMGGQFSSFPPHTHPFSTFPFEKVNICFCLIKVPFPLEWVLNLYFTPNEHLFWNCMISFFLASFNFFPLQDGWTFPLPPHLHSNNPFHEKWDKAC